MIKNINFKQQEKVFSLPYILISDSQTAGFGKNRRHFISQKGGIYLSLVVPMTNLVTINIGLLKSSIAWQLCQAIRQQFKISTDVKWVNDLLLNDKKVSGILIENWPKQAVVIGIGCNLYQSNLT